MSATIMEARLLAALQADQLIAQRGCQATVAAGGGVAIERRGHHLGLWRWDNGTFTFLAAGYTETSAAMETVAEAVHFTRQRFFAS